MNYVNIVENTSGKEPFLIGILNPNVKIIQKVQKIIETCKSHVIVKTIKENISPNSLSFDSNVLDKYVTSIINHDILPSYFSYVPKNALAKRMYKKKKRTDKGKFMRD